MLRYADAAHTWIDVGDGRFVPAVAGNRDFDELVATGTSITPYTPPAPTVHDVRAVAALRIRMALGVSSDAAAMVVQVKALERVASINDQRIGGATVSADDQAFLDAARLKRAELEAIRAASNVLEAMTPVPADFADDARWP